MSVNRYNEVECAIVSKPEKNTTYYISRDAEGKYVLREGNSNGKEIFSPIGDNGKKQKKRGRVFNAMLLYRVIEE